MRDYESGHFDPRVPYPECLFPLGTLWDYVLWSVIVDRTLEQKEDGPERYLVVPTRNPLKLSDHYPSKYVYSGLNPHPKEKDTRPTINPLGIPPTIEHFPESMVPQTRVTTRLPL